MNERLRDLMLQAGYAAPELAGRAQKLAELLVKECAEIADNKYDCGKFPVGCHILEHFGVEE